jgi:K+-sensing histidine kinase KdpD
VPKLTPFHYPKRRIFRYGLAILGVAVVTGLLAPFRLAINSTTVALALLLVVLFAASLWGSGPALVASVVAVLAFNFFFLPPFGALTIIDPQNWIALAAFLITAITAGQLSARANRRAEEAEKGRVEIERLYGELQAAFVNASHAEALRQSEKLKSALLDAVSHDIRTPLTAIKASVTTLLDEARVTNTGELRVSLDANSRREMLEVIDEESDRLNRFIEGLIELARIEAGQLTLRRRWGSMEEIIGMALERAETLTRNHLIELDLQQELPIARVDPRAVAEVVYTLIDNAAKYSPSHTHIRIEASQVTDRVIQISVSDEGQGIAEDLRERVFDKFFRAIQNGDIGSSQSQTGSGMGLAIARGIVEAHGGSIWIEPGSGNNGTRISFTLPIGDEDENSS